MKRLSIALVLLLGPQTVLGQADSQTAINFSKTEEIQLAVSQAELAFQHYEQSIVLEGNLPMMQTDKTAVDRDRELLGSAKGVIAGLKRKPEAFHGVGGLLLLSLLDDASRNAALCQGAVFSEIGKYAMSKERLEPAKAYEWMHIGQACMDVSTQLYTVSENVHALLVRDVESQQAVNQQATEMLSRCSEILKSKKAERGGQK